MSSKKDYQSDKQPILSDKDIHIKVYYSSQEIKKMIKDCKDIDWSYLK